MKAILINAIDKVVEEIELDDTLDAYKATIGCHMIDCVRLCNPADDVIYIDDEGLYNANDFFAWGDFMHPLAGNGLVLGTDNEGGSVEPTITLEEVEANVRFIDVDAALEMAKAADELTMMQAAASDIPVIHFPSADILKDREYTD